MIKTYSEEVAFCASYLNAKGITPEEYAILAKCENEFPFEIVRKKESDSFFEELASKLRELWPPGEKSGKWPWRDSQKNIVKRLQVLWRDRNLSSYSIDDCLVAARRYLAQFEEDTKYMKILKKFILTQKDIMMSDASIKHVNESMLADLLEGKKELAQIDEEWESILTSESIGEGELI